MALPSQARALVGLIRGWAPLLVAVGVGVLVGLAGYTFTYARGGAYLTNDPAACANCHVMRDQLDGWRRGSHRAVATCNDCHAPHTTVAKLAIKALNGFKHSWAFSTGRFHEPIRITGLNLRVTEDACRHCHSAMVSAIESHAQGPVRRADERVSCVRCHASVGHLH